MRQRTIVLFALVLMLTGVSVPLPASVAARQATPDATGMSLPTAPDPTLCQVEPRPVADYEALVGTSAAATPTVFHEPPGTPAEQGIIDAVTATVIEFAACQNAGEFLRAGALYTDDGLAEDFFWIDPDAIAFFAGPPEPRVEEDRETPRHDILDTCLHSGMAAPGTA